MVKLTFTRGVNVAAEEYEHHKAMDRCPLCSAELNEDGVCPKSGYRKR